MRPVVLVGPPGAGKSTVAALLAERFGVDAVDTDTVIEHRAGKAISEIFTADGEETFRALEREVIAETLASHRGVISLGGGAVTSPETRALLDKHDVVFLSVGLAEGARRTGLSTARPLLAGVNPRATFAALLEQRLPAYREVASIEIDTDQRDPRQVVEEIIARLGRDPGSDRGHGIA